MILWFVAAFAQSSGAFLSPGPLAQAHAHLDGVTTCTSCHAPLQGIVPSRCLACHERVQGQITSKQGFHANKATACESCHADHRGLDFDMVKLEEDAFDHGETSFPLTGAHDDVDCAACHTEKDDWTGLLTACGACHDDVHGAPASTRDLLEGCDACHTTKDWMVKSIPTRVFDHTNAAQVDYVLEGAHLQVACRDCHAEAVFLPTQHERCADCHSDPHRTKFGKPCESCHTGPTSWRVPAFDHRVTAFQLEGQHAEVACRSCHQGRATRPVPHEVCADCHQDPHRAQFVPQPCSDCHTVQIPAFAIPTFDHAKTDFPLRGKHVEQTCAACHGAGTEAQYRPLPHADCKDCHADQHGGQFEPTPCLVCHVETGWAVQDFDHDRTAFPLTGDHQQVECASCHLEGRYAGLPFASCGDCHTETAHGPGLTTACTACHATTGFKTVAFDHDQTGWALTQPHTRAACADCHVQITDFKGTDTRCNSCHQDDRPKNHFAGSCDGCHQGAAWLPAGLGDYDHSVTGFALRGLHAAASCADCHPEGQPRGSTPDGCGDCHRTDDPHRNLLGNQCGDCHTESGWYKTRFRHAQTGWPLIGLHRVAECADCHAVSYVGTPTACWRCHESQASLDIEAHTSTFFGTCDECHNPYSWTSVRYAH